MINVLSSGNSYVFDGVLTGILSILKRTQTKDYFNFYVYTMDVSFLKKEYTPISDSEIEYLDGIVKKYNEKNSVTKIDVTEYYNKEFKGSPNEGCYCSPYTLLRLLADIIPEMPNDKLLYLDCDTMFNRDIEELYNLDVEGYEYLAANDHYGKLLLNPRYINAGVLLFNMAECKKTGILTKARALIRKKHLPFADQSALIRSTTKFKLINQKFNDQKHLRKNTVVRHFAKRLFLLPYPKARNIKQWRIYEMHRIYKYKQFDDILNEYIYYKLKYEKEIKNP